MTDLGQYQTGLLKSTAKSVTVRADDGSALVYKNMGNNHNYPFIWTQSVVMPVSGTEVLLASGVSFHGTKLADACSITFAPYADPGDVRLYVDCDTVNNVIKIKSTGTMAADLTIKVITMMGTAVDLSGVTCRGNTGSMPTYP